MLRKIESQIIELTKECFENVPQHLPSLIISDKKSTNDGWDFSTAWAFKVAPMIGLETKAFVSRLICEACLKDNFFGKISLSGDGYINISLKDSWINEQIMAFSENFKDQRACNAYEKGFGNDDFLISYCYSKICRVLEFYELLEKKTAVINNGNRHIAIIIVQLLDPSNEKEERKLLERLAKVFYQFDSHLTWSSLTNKDDVETCAVLYKACGFAIKSVMDKLGIPEADY